jgi:hypothetical protein
VEKYCRARQATDDKLMRRMRFACSINKATHTQIHTESEYAIHIVFPLQESAFMLRLYLHCFSFSFVLHLKGAWGIVVVKALRY